MHLWPPLALWVLSRVESTSSARRTKPPTSNRLCGRQGKALSSFSSFLGGLSPLRRRPKGFPLALWKPSGPCSKGVAQKNRFLVDGKGKTFLSPSVLQRVSPLRRRPKGFPLALWKPSGPYLLKRLRARKLNLSSSSFQQSDAVSGSYARLSSPGTRSVITPVCTSASRCSGLVSNT